MTNLLGMVGCMTFQEKESLSQCFFKSGQRPSGPYTPSKRLQGGNCPPHTTMVPPLGARVLTRRCINMSPESMLYFRIGVMVQWLRTCTSLAEDPV